MASSGAVLGLKRAVLHKASEGAHTIEKRSISLMVNGRTYALEVGNRSDEVDPSHTLAHTLRETLGLSGTKVGCDHGACGACTVLIDEKQFYRA